MTWFDRLRAEGQGRTKPQNFAAPNGEHIFVLGVDGSAETATLQSGDCTEIRQIVDLTDWDLVAATMDTIGVLMSQAQPQPGFADLDPLWWFDYDVGDPYSRVANRVAGAFALVARGDLEIGRETHSPAETFCRNIPIGGTAFLEGVNTPQWMAPSPLDAYTFQAWIDFDAVAHLSSAGINPIIFDCIDGALNGFRFIFSGSLGHSWTVAVSHAAAGIVTKAFAGYVIDSPNPGWTLFSLVWDISLPPADRLLLYIDDNPIPYLPSSVMGASPVAPALGTPVIIGDPLLWGSVDEMRMLPQALSQSQISDSYLETTEWPTPVDFRWLMQILINDEVYAERTIVPQERRRWTDFKAPVRHLSGACEVCFRLTLNTLSIR